MRALRLLASLYVTFSAAFTAAWLAGSLGAPFLIAVATSVAVWGLLAAILVGTDDEVSK